MDLIKSSTIFFCIMTVLTADQLQCPSCTYVTTKKDLVAQAVINPILDAFSEPKCAARLTGPTDGIKMETCEPPEGKIAMCRYYNGTVDLKVVFVITYTVALSVHEQGCYYAPSANPLPVGCHDRENVNEDIAFIKQVMSTISSFTGDLLSFKGKMCVCADTYCKDDTGSGTKSSDTGSGTKISSFIQLLIVSQVFALLFML